MMYAMLDTLSEARVFQSCDLSATIAFQYPLQHSTPRISAGVYR